MRKATVFGAIFTAAILMSGEASAASLSASSSYFCKLISLKTLRQIFGCPATSTGAGNSSGGSTTSPGSGTSVGSTKPGSGTSGGSTKPGSGSSGGSTTPTTPTTPSSYNVSLSWTIPSAREDGKALSLSELSGYELYYTTDSSSATSGKVIKIDGGSQASYVISSLPAGTYYFAISAIDTSGAKSALSSMVSKKVGG